MMLLKLERKAVRRLMLACLACAHAYPEATSWRALHAELQRQLAAFDEREQKKADAKARNAGLQYK